MVTHARPRERLEEAPTSHAKERGLRDLSWRDALGIGKRAAREALDDNVTTWAGALAFSGFLALPAILLVSLGVFALTAGDAAVSTVLDTLGRVAPAEAVDLLGDSLTRVVRNATGGVAMVAVGGLLAVWTASGAMSTLITGLNRAYDVEETRGFLRTRSIALLLLAFGVLALGLVVGLLVLGPYVSEWVGSAVGLEGLVAWLWWLAQWPILLGALFGLFAGILYYGPNVEHRRFALITPGSVVAVVIWLGASGLFAVYVSMLGSYDKTWGTLAGAIVLLLWLWLSALALLLGAEVNAEVERSPKLTDAAS
jgi:membrane protein